MPYRSADRRRTLAAAALGRTVQEPGPVSEEGESFRAISGTVVDVSPHLVVLDTQDGREERLVIAPWATAWRGEVVNPADLPAGSNVIVKALRSGRVVDRIWADITRITGVIQSVGTEGKDRTLELYCGPHRGRRTIVVPYRASGRLQVRHPKFEPGYLFDAIGVREDGVSYARLPATSQPPYRWTAVPPSPTGYGGAQSRISGTATWADTFDAEEQGVAYPMLERADAACDDTGISCTGLPYLALGSMVNVRNVCSGRTSVLPVVACGCMAGRFCDRCLECGTSPRGRIVELSPRSFVELGGDLTAGCFNVRVGMG
ncbi:hypothetical protein FHS43_006240 [Streptosporangium becharense]|uniref:Uncharacterized protein n=1 Tax=Streptosporangium becharense TaxID=1816182 RepID=A0A7W9IGR2_9ACTN|nr:hypothetical protein [Streptosporangium becharense]MBB2914928.1 hypothetical protein [Streptosporangium becharense]MBB5820261.1 hypothetical protein [Streptosporangium becharense]